MAALHLPLHRRLSPLLTAAIGVMGCATVAAAAHPGQHMGVKITIGDEEIVYEILFSAELRNMVTPNDFSSFTYLEEAGRFVLTDPTDAERTEVLFEQFFQENNPVEVDGVLVKPLLKQLEFIPYVIPGIIDDPLDYPPDARITLSYPTKGRPQQVSMAWDLYPQDASRTAFGLNPSVEVVAELDAYDQNKIIVYTIDAPVYLWQYSDKPAKRRVKPVVTSAEPAGFTLPLLSLCIVIVWGIVLLVLRFSRMKAELWRPALGLSVVPLGAALLLHNTLGYRVVSPGRETVELPPAEEAAEMFAALQRNVYRAFDYKTESDIYDVLVQSVDGDLLDRVYNEVYQSLILRDQGGAIARVESVDILEADLESAGVIADSSAAAFCIRSRWQVRGAVYHWGHVHSRTNEYKALYTVASRGDKWKIVAVDDVEKRRIVKEGDDPAIESRVKPKDPM